MGNRDDLTENEKFALMITIISSIDQYISSNTKFSFFKALENNLDFANLVFFLGQKYELEIDDINDDIIKVFLETMELWDKKISEYYEAFKVSYILMWE